MFVCASRLVAEMPPTSGVITTPDVLVVKLVPDYSLIIVLGCYCGCVCILVIYILQQVVGVRITAVSFTLVVTATKNVQYCK